MPLKLSKKHLLLIATHCSNETQQDIFIESVVRQSLNTVELKTKLLLGTAATSKGALVQVDDLVIKTSYDLRSLGIDSSWGEKAINKHIIKDISTFIKLVLGNNWSFLPDQSISIGGRDKYLDLVFYNVIAHRYLVIDLKCSSLVSGIDRARSQMTSYVKAYDLSIDFTFQKKTIGIILGKAPIDSEYFNSSGALEYIFYCEFKI